MSEAPVIAIKFKVVYKGKEYTQVHGFDVRWNVISFTGKDDRLITLNYGPRGDEVDIFVKVSDNWIRLK
jgi:hypothetical protein